MVALTHDATIGIIGGGQLGMMLADAAKLLGYKTHIYAPEHDCPAALSADLHSCASYEDEEALLNFAQAVDVVTFEFENIPAQSLRFLDRHVKVFPKPEILDICRNRNVEKQTLNECGLMTAPFAPIRSADDLVQALQEIGVPSVIKTAEMGYDGKGQIKIESVEDAGSVWQQLNAEEAVLEGWVPFDRELSVIVARDQSGMIACYDPVHNEHRHHILYKTTAPAPDANGVNAKAIEVARTIAESLDLVGILAVELFVTKDHQVLVNEMAPRPHNSGHWSIEGAATSQFTQLMRIVAGMGVGATTTNTPCVMINLIGDDVYDLAHYEQNPKAHIHLYGKKEVRAGRKMGHVTITQD